MTDSAFENLRILIANQRADRLDEVTAVVVGLGHEVVARSTEVLDVAAITEREAPDLALVGLGESSQHALELIAEITSKASCPVIAIIRRPDPKFVTQAAKRGVFAFIVDDDPEEWQGAIEVVLSRFADYRNLSGAFGRRAVLERAKGILMERHGVDEDVAFAQLRDAARSKNQKIFDLAEAVIQGHPLLRKPRTRSRGGS